MKTNTDLFEKAPVPKAVATMAVPKMMKALVFQEKGKLELVQKPVRIS